MRGFFRTIDTDFHKIAVLRILLYGDIRYFFIEQQWKILISSKATA
ncbi:hypothetical protein IE02_2705 [Fibrobacter succinogenes subsp. elongatus]|jgi:hypothetical protein|uniref:Uncharacterized protein n=1 Tax=Fibrobacter succinogenes TaxID=833 RepID=A0A380S8F1_FIBSU|nr:hypothetical protein IE02_2705 [Fibrobacter succinogenes subsp. elongatus]SUQ25903.1 hypothetical protein SAMN05661053_2705 [Fibrobacter succinogenes]